MHGQALCIFSTERWEGDGGAELAVSGKAAVCTLVAKASQQI